MNKQKIQAAIKIAEKVTLLVTGAAALTLSVIDPRFEVLKLGVQVVGGLCLLFSLAPMVWSYAKANWPNDKKK